VLNGGNVLVPWPATDLTSRSKASLKKKGKVISLKTRKGASGWKITAKYMDRDT